MPKAPAHMPMLLDPPPSLAPLRFGLRRLREVGGARAAPPAPNPYNPAY